MVRIPQRDCRKKLAAVARRWAEGDGISESAREDYRVLGLSEQAIDALTAKPDVEVLPDNWEALNVFCACQTQWRSGFSGTLGLDYVAVHHVMEWLSVNPGVRGDVFTKVQIMEAEALRVFKERHGNE